MTEQPSAVARLASLANALEAVATAAASARPEELAACESPLQSALDSTPDAAELATETRADVLSELRRITLALQRCRRVGHAITELVTASLAAQGLAPGYAPAGAASQAPRLSRLEVRA